MYGPAAPPPRPSDSGNVVALRVLLTFLCLASCGLLAWTAMLRLALLRRRPVDWALFVSSLLLPVTLFVIVGATSEDSTPSDVAAGLLLLFYFSTPAYYLAMDIRYHRTLYRAPLRQPYAPSPSYGPQPYLPPQQPPPPAQQPSPPVQQPSPPGRPEHGRTPPGGQTPHPHRHSDSVRAELDELSDFLRREEER